jgi:hypothetical protein
VGLSQSQVQDLYRRIGAECPADIAPEKRQKYNSRKKEIRGHLFASTLEAGVYGLLSLWEQAGVISGLQLQPRFIIMDAYVDSNGKKVRKREYVADFLFVRDGKKIAVDAKGIILPMFALKSALFRSRYPEVDLQIWSRETLKSLY